MKKVVLSLILLVAIVGAGILVYEDIDIPLFDRAGGDKVPVSALPKISSDRSVHEPDPLVTTATPKTDSSSSTTEPIAPVAVSQPFVTKVQPKKPEPFNPGSVPVANIFDLYSSVSDPRIMKDLGSVSGAADKFVKDYKGKVQKLGAANTLKAIRQYEYIVDGASKASSMLQLARDINVVDDSATLAYSSANQASADIMEKITFFPLEIMSMSDFAVNNLYKDKKTPDLIRYKPFIDKVRRFKKYTLSEEMENFSMQKSATSSSAWSRMREDILGSATIFVAGDKYGFAQAMNLHNDKDPIVRKSASDEIGKLLKDNAVSTTAAINSIIKDFRLENKIRKYPAPMSSANLFNGIDDAVVANMIKTVKSSYQSTIQRYFKIKAKMLGLQRLKYSDRFAPFPAFDGVANSWFTWDQVQKTILDSYRQFSPKMADIAGGFFTNNWIDAKAGPNKAQGAYCVSGVPSTHPYILMSYVGSGDNVMTLAHEIGHGIHFVLSYPNGPLMFEPSHANAEMASMFGESIVFNSLLNKDGNTPRDRAFILSKKIENNINGALLAVAVTEFENNLHVAGSKSEFLSTSSINKAWSDAVGEAYGDTVELGEYDAYKWGAIGHIFFEPFYYYSYAVSQLTVDLLYDLYQKKSIPGFEDKFVATLASGGTKNYKETLAVFGLDPSKADFWQNALSMTTKMIDEFEKIVNDSAIGDVATRSSGVEPLPTASSVAGSQQVVQMGGQQTKQPAPDPALSGGASSPTSPSVAKSRAVTAPTPALPSVSAANPVATSPSGQTLVAGLNNAVPVVAPASTTGQSSGEVQPSLGLPNIPDNPPQILPSTTQQGSSDAAKGPPRSVISVSSETPISPRGPGSAMPTIKSAPDSVIVRLPKN